MQHNRQLLEDYLKKCASTGTPINNLHGAARQNAQMSNIGGGSKAIGGKGMRGGLKIIINNERSNAVLKTINKMNGYKRIPNR